jgi:hypothetical protein
MAPGLLAFGCSEGVAMLKPKIHFEQVPLELVRKIVEEQLRREKAGEQDPGARKNRLSDSGKRIHLVESRSSRSEEAIAIRSV